jgi:hypothetical protein
VSVAFRQKLQNQAEATVKRCYPFPMPDQYLDVESFRFADVVKHWARERLVHEVIVGRELTRGIIREGLRFNSVDPKWTKSNTELRGSPLVGFSPRQDTPPILLRAIALEHLLAVEREAVDPDLYLLGDEIITRNHFRVWLVKTGRSFPKFWFGPEERSGET